MSVEEKDLLLRNRAAYGVGVVVAGVAAAVTGPVIPTALSLPASVALGAVAWYAARKLLNPWSDAEREEQRTTREYRTMLDRIAVVARRVMEAGSQPCVGGEVSRHLASIARMVEMILERYRRRRDLAGASTALVVLQKFDEVLAHYIKVKCNELFIDRSQAEEEVAQVEGHVLPTVEQALEELGRKIDAGESMATEIRRGTLDDMLRSLELIKALRDQKDLPALKEESNDA